MINICMRKFGTAQLGVTSFSWARGAAWSGLMRAILTEPISTTETLSLFLKMKLHPPEVTLNIAAGTAPVGQQLPTCPPFLERRLRIGSLYAIGLEPTRPCWRLWPVMPTLARFILMAQFGEERTQRTVRRIPVRLLSASVLSGPAIVVRPLRVRWSLTKLPIIFRMYGFTTRVPALWGPML